jgi:hypothetical protein
MDASSTFFAVCIVVRAIAQTRYPDARHTALDHLSTASNGVDAAIRARPVI